jgi:hypothetical protein
MNEILPIERIGASERTLAIIEKLRSAVQEEPQTPEE